MAIGAFSVADLSLYFGYQLFLAGATGRFKFSASPAGLDLTGHRLCLIRSDRRCLRDLALSRQLLLKVTAAQINLGLAQAVGLFAVRRSGD